MAWWQGYQSDLLPDSCPLKLSLSRNPPGLSLLADDPLDPEFDNPSTNHVFAA